MPSDGRYIARVPPCARSRRSIALALALACLTALAAMTAAATALPREEAEAAIEQAEREAAAAGVHGPRSTPWVLARVAELTEGRSVLANLALIENNALIAAELAAALAAGP